MKNSYEFSITTYCQANCYSCQRTDEMTGVVRSNLKLEHMPLDFFEKILKGIDLSHTHFIKFCGESGDPMMHPHIENFISKITIDNNQYNCTVIISTNGGLRTPKWYSKMASLNRDNLAIVFGIDGIDHDINWKYREGVDWQRAMDNMVAFKKAGGHAVWQFIIFPWNIHQIESANKKANSLNIPINFIFNERNGKGQLSESDILYSKSILREINHGMS